MGRPLHPLRAIDLHALFPHREAVAYLDTLGVLFTRRPSAAGWNELMVLAEGRIVDGRGRSLLARGAPTPTSTNAMAIHFRQPPPELLRFLSTLSTSTCLTTRVDVSVDLVCASQADVRQCDTSFRSVMVQKHHGDRASREFKNTQYWGKPDARRNIALYSDKVSKATGELCAHFDLRYIGARACREAKLDDLLKLADGVDAMRLLKREARIALLDQRQVDEELERWAAQVQAGQGRTSKRPGEEVRRRLRGWVSACVQNDSAALIEGALGGAHTQEVLERFPRFGKCVIKRNWDEVMDPPRWVAEVKV